MLSPVLMECYSSVVILRIQLEAKLNVSEYFFLDQIILHSLKLGRFKGLSDEQIGVRLIFPSLNFSVFMIRREWKFKCHFFYINNFLWGLVIFVHCTSVYAKLALALNQLNSISDDGYSQKGPDNANLSDVHKPNDQRQQNTIQTLSMLCLIQKRPNFCYLLCLFWSSPKLVKGMLPQKGPISF